MNIHINTGYVLPSGDNRYVFILFPGLSGQYRVKKAPILEVYTAQLALTEGLSYTIGYRDNTEDDTITVLTTDPARPPVRARLTLPPMPRKAIVACKLDAHTVLSRNGDLYVMAEPVGEVCLPNPRALVGSDAHYWKTNVEAVFEDGAFIEWMNVDAVEPVGDADESHLP